MEHPRNGSRTAGAETSQPRRSALLQDRSRDTRRRLIRAALELWNERGFERAVEDTTAEEIARAAGVSKGTFYFHFAHKEDILLEMQWATVEIMAEEARRGMDRGEDTSVLVEQLMTSTARRVSRAPRAAVLRVTGQWSRLSHDGTFPETPRGFGEVFQAVLHYARERGDVPPDTDVDELASLLMAVTMDALVRWAATTQSAADLGATLCRRADVVFRGAAASYER